MMVRTRKGIAAALTALALAAGIFAGRRVPAEAAELPVEVQAIDISLRMPTMAEDLGSWNYDAKVSVKPDNVFIYVECALVTATESAGYNNSVRYNGRTWYSPKQFLPDAEYGVLVVANSNIGSGGSRDTIIINKAEVKINGKVTKLEYKGTGIGWAVLELKEGTDTGRDSTEDSRRIETAVQAVHVHSYSWVTVQEASAKQDGMEEYRCSCGDVLERNLIPAYSAVIKSLCDSVKNAPQGGEVQADTGGLYTLSDDIVKKLAERTDVTIVLSFEYERKAYRMTIPAGVDYSALLAENAGFYGYFYFAGAVGAVIEEV